MTRRYTTLISAAELAGLLASEAKPVVVDTSFDLADTGAGERRFAASHVPGSRYLHLDRDLSGPKTGANGRHPLPGRAAFARTVAALGISPETQVVCLDAQGGVYAARGWWLLRWLGHDRVAVLDGGMQSWQRAGGALVGDDVAIAGPTAAADTNAPRPLAADAAPVAIAYPSRPSLAPSIDVAGVAARAPRVTVLDARSGERFRGEVEPIDAVAGHIPGALNRFHRQNLADGGEFKAPSLLRDEFAALLADRAPAEVIHSCGSGVTACHNLLAMEHAGLAGSLLYPGSWSEWSADPARAIARG
jgi:thiosulfate/3-mercaptopyruvate sulfurtransferase